MNKRKLQKVIRIKTEPQQLRLFSQSQSHQIVEKSTLLRTTFHQRTQSKWNIITNYVENGKLKTRSHSASSSLSKEERLQVSRLKDQKIERYIYDRKKINQQLRKRIQNGRCLLQGFKVGETTSKTLSSIITSNYFFQLQLSECSITDKILLNLSYSIKHQQIVHLNLSNNQLTSSGILKIYEVFGTYPSLVKLNLSKNKVGDSLSQLLPCFPNLKILVIDNCNIQNNLEDVLLSLPEGCLQAISLRGNKLNGKYITQRSINYFYYNQFKQLNLDDNPLGTYFMQAITHKPRLIGRYSLKIQKFNLSNSNINSEAAGCFLQKISDPIHSLNLSLNNLQQLSITSNLSIFKFTTDLILRDCKLGQSFAKSLSLSLRTNGLQHLDVSLNNFEYFMNYVAQAINESSTLVTLIMNKCLLTDKSISDFDLHLKENIIKNIQLKGNYITNRSIPHLNSIINKCKKIKKFNLDKTLLAYQSILKLRDAIPVNNQQIMEQRKNNKFILQKLQTETTKGFEQIKKEINRVNYRQSTIQSQIIKLKQQQQALQERITDQDKKYRITISNMAKQLKSYEHLCLNTMWELTDEISKIQLEIQKVRRFQQVKKPKLKSKQPLSGQRRKKSKQNVHPLFLRY